MNNLLLLNLKSIYQVLGKYIDGVIVYENNTILVRIRLGNLRKIAHILKNSLLFNFRGLVDITAVDNFFFIDRFEVFYNFLNYKARFRFLLSTFVKVSSSLPYGIGLESLSSLYKSAVWLEREVWDMFGIFFLNHPDLRRILTDYGFSGFPFRKDFPLTGYKEIRYDETQKLIVTESVKLNQEFRSFGFINPWVK
jgi:NADH-quinone oxidoreductase subunit C